jgi:hypothetical protein
MGETFLGAWGVDYWYYFLLRWSGVDFLRSVLSILNPFPIYPLLGCVCHMRHNNFCVEKPVRHEK